MTTALLLLIPLFISGVQSTTEDDLAQGAFEGLGCTVTNPRIDNIRLSNADTDFFEVRNIIERMERTLDESSPTRDARVRVNVPRDCSHVDSTQSGVFSIMPSECDEPIQVFCDMETDGGGWTVIQRRQNGAVGFNRGWVNYEKGFGSKYSEYWLGNDALFWLTAQDRYELRVDLGDFQGDTRYAVYEHFKVGDRGTRYKLILGGYKEGDAGDALSSHNHAPFTTPDYDNDKATTGNCAGYFFSGWWFTNCYHANLNGIYRPNGEELDVRGIVWSEWRSLNISLKSTEMKIRPIQIPQ